MERIFNEDGGGKYLVEGSSKVSTLYLCLVLPEKSQFSQRSAAHCPKLKNLDASFLLKCFVAAVPHPHNLIRSGVLGATHFFF